MKRVLSFLLVLTMLCGLITAFAAEEAPAEEPVAETPVEEVIPEEVPAEEPAEVPVEEAPAEAPVEEAAPAEETAEEEAPAEEAPAAEEIEVITDGDELPDDITANTITTGDTHVSLTVAGEVKYYSFTPKVTGIYAVCSSGNRDTYVELYDNSTKDLLAENDDGYDDEEDNYNFYLEYEMTADTTYVYAVFFASDISSGDFDMSLALTAATGTCGAEGDNLKWKFSLNDYSLAITGTGAMADYTADNPSPWNSYISNIAADTTPQITVSIAEGVTSIGAYAFYGCAFANTGSEYTVRTVVLPTTLTAIGTYAFACSHLSEIDIPAAVASIGEYAFYNCTNLEYACIGTVAEDGTASSALTVLNEGVFCNCTDLGEVVLPDTLTSIGDAAFFECGLYYVEILGKDDDRIIDMIIPSSVTSIGNYAFYNCIDDYIYTSADHICESNPSNSNIYSLSTNGRRVYIPESVKTIGKNAFDVEVHKTQIQSYETPTSMLYLSYVSAVYYAGSADEWMAISGIDGLGGSIASNFIYYNFVSFAVSSQDDVLYSGYIGDESVDNSLVKYIFAPTYDPATGKETGTLTILGTGTMSSYLPWAETNADDITELVIMEGITAIPDKAFAGCINLEKAAIAASVETIGDGAFYECYRKADDTPTGLATVTFADGSKLTSIGEAAFYGCENLSDITIPSKVISIGDYAFGFCRSLTSITIPVSVQTIGTAAFAYCDNLSEIIFAAGTTHGKTSLKIDDGAFYDCAAETVRLPARLKSVGEDAFTSDSLKSLYIYSIDWDYDTEGIAGITHDVSKKVTLYGYYNSDTPGCASRCSYIFICLDHMRDEDIEGKITTPATCTTAGEIEYTCVQCGHTYTEVIPATGHNYSDVVVTAPTCTTQGYTTYKCTNEGCTATYVTDIKPASGHAFNEGVVTAEPSCTETGLKTYTCTNDGCGYSYTEVIPSLGGHKYDEGVVTKPATCGDTGIRTYTCTVEGCGHTYTEVIPATGGHKYDEGVVTKPATCGDTGIRTYTCTAVGCGHTYTEIIPATGNHSFDEGVVQKAATATQTGIMLYTCETCHHTYTAKIAKLAVMHAGTGWEYYHGSYYYFIDSKMVVSGWVLYDNGWYYMDENGVMVTGVYDVPGDTTYYFADSGKMYANTWLWMNDTYYYFGNDGRMVKNNWVWWGAFYFMDEDGRMVTGEKTVSGLTYLFTDDGIMYTGWLWTDGGYVYYGADNSDGLYGAMYRDHWLWYGSSYYYLKADGIMVTGAYTVGSTAYTFDSTGRWIG